MADDKKVAQCSGCFRSCKITARELKVGSGGVIKARYYPKIGTIVITSYVCASGASVCPVFSYPVDAIVFAQEVLCKCCDRYRER